jgi:hypothetical protein
MQEATARASQRKASCFFSPCHDHKTSSSFRSLIRGSHGNGKAFILVLVFVCVCVLVAAAMKTLQ